MTAIAVNTDDVRLEAARLAAALIRFAQVAAHPLKTSTPPGSLRVGTEPYVFMPSSRWVPREQLETFLVSLPSPALLAPTTIRGMLPPTLLHELSGERRRGFGHVLGNCPPALEHIGSRVCL